MELTEAMKKAGWRECPDDAVRLSWELNGGRWQIMQWLYDGFTPAYIRNPDPKYAHLGLLDCEIKGAWRPVNPETWDYDPRGWGEQPAPVVPNRAGWWWRKDRNTPVVVETCIDFSGDEIKTLLTWEDDDWCRNVENDGQWIGPCVKPEVPNV